ncbi:MAG TPA: hypothetical protein VF846_08050 [Thermoanaerobaculia bacterium]
MRRNILIASLVLSLTSVTAFDALASAKGEAAFARADSPAVTRTFTVTTTADAGTGSLREAIERVNVECAAGDSVCKIDFNLPRPSTIAPLTPLPAITACGKIDIFRMVLTSTELDLEISGRNVSSGSGLEIRPHCSEGVRRVSLSNFAINGFPDNGLTIHPTLTKHHVEAAFLFIGTDLTGLQPRPNAWRGIALTSSLASMRLTYSVVSGNGRSGIWAWDSDEFRITWSNIGAGRDGRPLGNGASGVAVLRGKGYIDSSTIAYNGHWGVSAVPGASMNAAHGNSIHSNGVLGVDWGIDFQTLQQLPNSPAAPVITSASFDPATGLTTIRGTITLSIATPNRHIIHVYSNSRLNARGFVEGEHYEGLDPELDTEGRTGTIEWEVPTGGDLRGRILSAITSYRLPEADWAHSSSEFSNPFFF